MGSKNKPDTVFSKKRIEFSRKNVQSYYIFGSEVKKSGFLADTIYNQW